MASPGLLALLPHVSLRPVGLAPTAKGGAGALAIHPGRGRRRGRRCPRARGPSACVQCVLAVRALRVRLANCPPSRVDHRVGHLPAIHDVAHVDYARHLILRRTADAVRGCGVHPPFFHNDPVTTTCTSGGKPQILACGLACHAPLGDVAPECNARDGSWWPPKMSGQTTDTEPNTGPGRQHQAAQEGSTKQRDRKGGRFMYIRSASSRPFEIHPFSPDYPAQPHTATRPTTSSH